MIWLQLIPLLISSSQTSTLNFPIDKPLAMARITERVLGSKDAHCDGRGNYALARIRVHLTVSPMASVSWLGSVERRLLVMHWRVPSLKQVHKDDWVGLFDKHVGHGQKNLKKKDALASARVAAKSTAEGVGWLRLASVSLNYTDELEMSNDCHLYHVAYVHQGRVLASNCLRKEPFWMNQMNVIIGDVPLPKLMLPGSHESGAIRQFAGYFADAFYYRYSVTQDESVWNQLVWGVRYLDLHTHIQDDNYGIVHNAIHFGNLSHVLKQVAKFVRSTREVVIVHMRTFHPEQVGQDEEERRHRHLAKAIVDQIGNLLYPYHPLVAPHVTLKACQRIDRRIIMAYQHEAVQRHQPLLWPAPKVLWSLDSVTPLALKAFLNASYERSEKTSLTTSMAHLSVRRDIMYKDANPLDVADVWRSGIRHMADSLVNNIEHWYEFNWWKDANIVAFDFVLANDLIAVTQRVNYRRFVCGLFNNTEHKSRIRTSTPALIMASGSASSSIEDLELRQNDQEERNGVDSEESSEENRQFDGKLNNNTSQLKSVRAKIANFLRIHGGGIDLKNSDKPGVK